MLLPLAWKSVVCNDQLITATVALNGSACSAALQPDSAYSPLLSVSAFVTRSGFHKPAFLFSTQKSNNSFRTEWSDIMTWWRVHNVPPLHALNCRQHNDPERSSAKMLLESISGPFNLLEPEKSSGEDILIALPPHCVAYIVTWIFMRHQMCRKLIPVHFSIAEDSHHPHLLLFIIYLTG